jgi:DNA-binding transcriptional LysR family regulator
VANAGLITKAAADLHITQSPLSQQMILLEEELGVPLFERSKKHLTLTEAGLVLKQRAEQILDLKRVTVSEVRDTAKGLRGRLTIGIINSSGSLLLPEIIQKYHQSYPNISFDLRQGDNAFILERLNSHLIDIGFVRLPIETQLYNFFPVPAEKLIIVGSPEILKFPKATLPLLKLKDQTLLIHRRYQKPLMDYFHHKGIEPNILCISDELVPLLSWAQCGLGLAIVPEYAARLVVTPNLTVKKLSQPVLPSSSALVWRKDEKLPATAVHLLELFKKKWPLPITEKKK